MSLIKDKIILRVINSSNLHDEICIPYKTQTMLERVLSVCSFFTKKLYQLHFAIIDRFAASIIRIHIIEDLMLKLNLFILLNEMDLFGGKTSIIGGK